MNQIGVLIISLVLSFPFVGKAQQKKDFFWSDDQTQSFICTEIQNRDPKICLTFESAVLKTKELKAWTKIRSTQYLKPFSHVWTYNNKEVFRKNFKPTNVGWLSF